VAVETVVEVDPIPQPTRMSGERCNLPSGVWAEPQPKRRLGVLYAIFMRF